jgi:hypothetical protein
MIWLGLRLRLGSLVNPRHEPICPRRAWWHLGIEMAHHHPRQGWQTRTSAGLERLKAINVQTATVVI